MNKNPELHNQYVAFEGKKFTIEWYFDKNGKSSALNYYESLNDKDRIKVLGLFELIGNMGEIKNITKFRYEEDKIYAFKPKPHRFLCFFFAGHKIIVTNAFNKKSDKFPVAEKTKALKNKCDYEERIKQGDYYE